MNIKVKLNISYGMQSAVLNIADPLWEVLNKCIRKCFPLPLSNSDLATVVQDLKFFLATVKDPICHFHDNLMLYLATKKYCGLKNRCPVSVCFIIILSQKKNSSKKSPKAQYCQDIYAHNDCM